MGFDDNPRDEMTEVDLCVAEIYSLKAENERLRKGIEAAIERLSKGRPSAAWGGLAAVLDGYPNLD